MELMKLTQKLWSLIPYTPSWNLSRLEMNVKDSRRLEKVFAAAGLKKLETRCRGMALTAERTRDEYLREHGLASTVTE